MFFAFIISMPFGLVNPVSGNVKYSRQVAYTEELPQLDGLFVDLHFTVVTALSAGTVAPLWYIDIRKNSDSQPREEQA